MATRLPESIDVAGLHGRTVRLEGVLATAGMARLVGVGEPDPEARVALTLEVNNRGEARLHGEVAGAVTLQCQRCLEPVTVPVASTLDFALVEASEATHGESESADVLVVRDGTLELAGVVEDELLLALPVVARHRADETCAPADRHFGPPGEPEPQRENPFAVLERLKRRDDE